MTEKTNPSAVERWTDCEGARLFALDEGSGRPLVFLHGGMADHRAARLRVAPLAPRHRVITPDLRGAGRSRFGGALDWDRYADDVVALLDDLEIERATIGGVSMGSGVAVRFALTHPERVAGLVVMSPVFAGADRGLNAAQRDAFAKMDAAGQRTLTDGIESLRPLYAALPEPIHSAAIAMMLGFDPESVAATTRFLATGAQPFDSIDALAAIEAPVLLVPGADPEHPREVAELYAAHLANAEWVEPEDFVARADAFQSAIPSQVG